MAKVVATIKREFLEILPAMIFFAVLFNTVAYTRALMLEQYSIALVTSAAATILALVVAKVILIVDLFPVVNRFKDKPVIYNVLWRTFLYSLCALFIEYLEEFIPRVWGGNGFAAANRAIFEEFVWQKFAAIHIWLTIGIFVYCSATELAESLGTKCFRELFAGPRPEKIDSPTRTVDKETA
jgi:hypothetical protein